MDPEEITNIPPPSKRREWQWYKPQSIGVSNTINTRLKQLSSGKLKRSSYTLETKALQREHGETLSTQVKPIDFSIHDYSSADKLRNVSIKTSVPNIMSKDEQSDIVKKTP